VITLVQLLEGTVTLKFGRAKNIQNLARFRTIFDFDREYLWNGWRYRQAMNGVINYDFSRIEQKNGKLWSTNTRDYGASVYSP